MKNAFGLTVTAAIVFLLVGAAIAGERGRPGSQQQQCSGRTWDRTRDLSRVKRALSR